MTIASLLVEWDGECFKPLSPQWARQADRHFAVGQTYRMEVREERSPQSHNHYFASISEAWENLPPALGERFATADHLRKYALIRAGYRDERSIVCGSKAEAQRVAAFIKPLDDYAVVVARDAVVVVFTAKSQSMRAMGKKAFAESKQKVLDVVAQMIGTSAGDLGKNAGQAA